MDSNGMSIADALALQKQDDNFGGGWLWVFFLFFLLAWGNGGLFGGNSAAAQYATQADIQRGFDQNTVVNKLDGLSKGICDLGYAMNNTMLNGFNGIQRDLCSGFNGVNQTLNNGFNSVNTNINQLSYQMQQCCCDLKTSMLQDKYENVSRQLAQATDIINNTAQSQYILGQLGKFYTYPAFSPCNCYSCNC